jgi:hypothetical protein
MLDSALLFNINAVPAGQTVVPLVCEWFDQPVGEPGSPGRFSYQPERLCGARSLSPNQLQGRDT